MASSIVGGLIASGHPPSAITASDPYPASLDSLKAATSIATYSDNAEAVKNADVVILAVKPQVMADATASIASAVQTNSALVLSIAAGVTVAAMEARLGTDAAIVRCMPNTPALLGEGASGLYANKNVTAKQQDYAEQILSAVGITCWVNEESALDAITALSGSGPAYFFLFTEAMIDAGVSLGLEREVASKLALQTGLGAARMGIESDVDLAELRKRVTSPAGTTEKAIESFEANHLRDTITKAMQAAAQRAEEMAREMG